MIMYYADYIVYVRVFISIYYTHLSSFKKFCIFTWNLSEYVANYRALKKTRTYMTEKSRLLVPSHLAHRRQLQIHIQLHVKPSRK